MSTPPRSNRVWWALLIALYIGLLIWWIASLDPNTVCSNTSPC